MFAAVGAVIFANAWGNLGLADWPRGCSGSGSLPAGLKAIADRFPLERVPLLNGASIAFGAAGAVTATAPLDWLLAQLDWRSVFVLLSVLTVFVALTSLLTIREPCRHRAPSRSAFLDVRSIYVDLRFWRLAPLSALCLGSAWAFQGLCVAPWLADVALLGRAAIVHHLFIMGISLCAGALLIGIVSQVARSFDIGPEYLFGALASVFIAAELTLVCRIPLPSQGICALLAAMGRSRRPQLCFVDRSLLREVRGRANAALNVLHIGAAFAIQTAIGLIVGLWERDGGGHYPAQAYQIAFRHHRHPATCRPAVVSTPRPLPDQWIPPLATS
jgi:predicted MFS family arabinose efflux permease